MSSVVWFKPDVREAADPADVLHAQHVPHDPAHPGAAGGRGVQESFQLLRLHSHVPQPLPAPAGHLCASPIRDN